MIRRALMLLAAPALLSAQNWDSIQVKAQPLRGGVYMLTGNGGNIGLSVGPDGAFIVDDQFQELSAKILAAIKAITPLPVKFVVNTHWHFDHVGGNENMGKAGALLVAHDNVRRRMSVEGFVAAVNRRTPAAPPGALPVITFTDSATFHWNGDDLVAFHVPPAHTDGDVLVHFTKANVIHMGDTFMTVSYPLIDLGSSGSIDGFITAADRALAVCGPETIIIPGHGPTTNCAGLREWRNLNYTTRDRVRAGMQKGQTLDQLKAAGLTREFDDKWGKGFITPAAFVESVYRSLGGK